MNTAIKKLVQYGIAKGLIEKEDAIYIKPPFILY